MATLCESTVFSLSGNSWYASGLRTFLVSRVHTLCQSISFRRVPVALTVAVKFVSPEQYRYDHCEWKPILLRNGDSNYEQRRGDIDTCDILR